ncbi:MAG: 4-hydroxy-tetrahydrodipicolinate reductase, partial [Leptospiraceae bacterium]|nr:4-hydroxy-tetrahydrodipicolinate reductase [Leptospiraceae bacterium]
DSILFGVDSGLNAGIKANQVPITDDLLKGLETADAVIDFSSVASTEAVLYACLQLNKPLVIGVTGLSEALIQKIREASEKIPIVQSPNMSVGVNLLFKLVELASGVLKENYDIEVLDIHHRHKKDSPSGTAQKLKDIMLKTLNRTEKNVIYGRHGDNYSERESEEIAIHSMRAGEVVGDHTVHFFSPEERIEIKHSAQDRKTFAVGAVKAAEFVVNQKPGLFDMFDVLGI